MKLRVVALEEDLETCLGAGRPLGFGSPSAYHCGLFEQIVSSIKIYRRFFFTNMARGIYSCTKSYILPQ